MAHVGSPGSHTFVGSWSRIGAATAALWVAAVAALVFIEVGDGNHSTGGEYIVGPLLVGAAVVPVLLVVLRWRSSHPRRWRWGLAAWVMVTVTLSASLCLWWLLFLMSTW